MHSDESVERAAITLRGITQELKGRGISAVMTLEEQIKALDSALAAEREISAKLEKALQRLSLYIAHNGDD